MIKPFKFVFFTVIITLISFTSCQNSVIELSKEFSCENTQIIENLEIVDDFQNNFSIQIPKHWNTKLYYDNKQSEIFSADTIKALTDSYIMDFSIVYAKLDIDKKLQDKVKQKLMDGDLHTQKESFHKFGKYNAFANLSKGKSKGIDLYLFQYYIHINPEKYMLLKTEFYGEENFDSRFCESLYFIEKLKIK